MRWIVLATIGYLVVLTHAGASGQQPAPPAPAYKNLPDGPGKTALVRMCSICHELERVLAVRQTPQGWATILENMSQRGASGTDEEWDALFEYLSLHFTPKSGSPAVGGAAVLTPPPFDAGKVRSGFTTAVNGGSIQMIAIDSTDAAMVSQIRTRLREAAKRFGSGDYQPPIFIDAQRRPDTESLKAVAAQITFAVEDVPGGGKMIIGSTDPAAIAVVQTFIQAQQRPER